MDERIAGQHTLLSFYRRYVIAETLTKNADYVLESAKNGGLEGKKRTKTSILCSKCPKTRVPDPKNAQKCRFCARNARKWGSRRPKAHKNLDFVLGRKGIGIRERGN